jgi:hypothetical protein
MATYPLPCIYDYAIPITFHQKVTFNCSHILAFFDIISPTGTIGLGSESNQVPVTEETFTQSRPLILPLLYDQSVHLPAGTKCNFSICHIRCDIIRHFVAQTFEIVDGKLIILD